MANNLAIRSRSSTVLSGMKRIIRTLPLSALLLLAVACGGPGSSSVESDESSLLANPADLAQPIEIQQTEIIDATLSEGPGVGGGLGGGPVLVEQPIPDPVFDQCAKKTGGSSGASFVQCLSDYCTSKYPGGSLKRPDEANQNYRCDDGK